MNTWIGALGVLSGLLLLLQSASGDPRPEFALSIAVPGTSRVSLAVGKAGTAVTAINDAVETYTIVSAKVLLSEVADIVASIANQFQVTGEAIINTVGTLAGSTSGDVDGVFGAAVDAVNEAIGFADNVLPGLSAPLVPLIGQALPDKFLDSLQHIGKALQALLVTLGELKTGAQSAVSDAGANPLSAGIVALRLPRGLVTQLTAGLTLLRGTVPLLEYVVSSTMEAILIGDAYMLELDAKVDTTIGASSELSLELGAAVTLLGNAISSTLTTVGNDLAGIVTGYGDLTNLATATSAADLSTVLASFGQNLVDLAQADPTVAGVLGQLNTALLDSYDVVDPLYYIYESSLVDTLITTLIANDRYSEYCFYKYKDLLFVLLETVANDASYCIAKEVERLEHIQGTMALMFEILFYDFMDIANDLDICDGIFDATNLQECTAKFVTIYTALEVAFGNKVTLGYTSLQHEIAATSNRLKICIRLSQSEMTETEIPRLTSRILECAAQGPYAVND